ncbi:MAG: competence/damage-inducible protein A [Gammaproteobacteria bacterium]
MRFGLIIIGSELLTGKRKDAHLDRAIEILGEHGLELGWCKLLTDNLELITAELRHSFRDKQAVVFSFGGIGSTPDDVTRQSAARAAGMRLVRHAEARAIIEARFGEAAYPHRIRMADLPQHCRLVPNPVNQIPGFSVGHHHFLPGFPEMAWPMVEWVLKQYYAGLFRSAPREVLLTVLQASEGQLVALMEAFVERFPGLQLSSLPSMKGPQRETELGVRGEATAVEAAVEWLTDELRRGGFRWRQRAYLPAGGSRPERL